MPTFRTDLPLQRKHLGFDLKRTPASGSLTAVITSETFLVCDTHFFHGRTLPCERISNDEGATIDDTCCPACVDKAGYRSHVYVSALIIKTSEHFIFECSANAAKAFDEYRKSTGTLRGCLFKAERPKGQRNSKVVIETNTCNLAKVKLPEAPDLIRALSVIWRIPAKGIEQVSDGKKNGRIKINSTKLRKHDTQPDGIPDAPTVGDILSQSRF